MSDPAIEPTTREAASWERFHAALARIPRERWDDVDVVPGWSVKQLLWHVAWWLDKCARNLEGMRTGEKGVADLDETVDERNQLLAAEARGMTVDEVYEGMVASRSRVLEEWAALPTVGEDAIEELADETYDHYEEHIADLERFAS